MSRFSHYGSGQRLAFAMLCVGFGLCLLGAVVPFWLKSEVKLSDITMGLEADIPVVGDLLKKLTNDYDLVKINMGVWVLCIEYVGSDTKCYNMYSSDEDTKFNVNHYGPDGYDNGADDNAWVQVVRVAIFINIKLSLICGLAACCRCMCCSGGRTIVHGIFAFIAGAFGIGAVGIMAAHRNDVMPAVPGIFDMEYDWAFFIYAAGSCLMVLSSLFLCFSIPRETPGGVVMMQMPGTPYVTVNTTNTNQNVINTPVSHYELNGQIRSFEPLPETAGFQHPPPPEY